MRKRPQDKPFRARTGSALRGRELLRPSKGLLVMNLRLGKNFWDTCGTFLRIKARPPKKMQKIQKINPNRPQILPNRPQIQPKSSPNRPPNDPKSIQNRLRRPFRILIVLGPIFRPNRVRSGSHLGTHFGSKIDQKSIKMSSCLLIRFWKHLGSILKGKMAPKMSSK